MLAEHDIRVQTVYEIDHEIFSIQPASVLVKILSKLGTLFFQLSLLLSYGTCS